MSETPIDPTLLAGIRQRCDNPGTPGRRAADDRIVLLAEVDRLTADLAAAQAQVMEERRSALTDAVDVATELIGYYPDVTGRPATAADVVAFIREMIPRAAPGW